MAARAHVSVVLSGGAALGAYEAGTMAALSVAMQRLLASGEDTVCLDAIGGASAGALVALFSAWALLHGYDAPTLLHGAWVERVSLRLLRGSADAPLDFDRLRAQMHRAMAGDGDGLLERRGAPVHRRSIQLHVALTALQGFTYDVRTLRRHGNVTGITYSDWRELELRAEHPGAALFEPRGASVVDFVLASAAHPAVFAPRLLDRSRDHHAARRQTPARADERIWYTDGGVVQSHPIGRILAAARRRDCAARERVRRITLLVDPRSEGPSGATRWTDADAQPSWTEALARALAILPAQVLYDDLHEIEVHNSRLERANGLADALLPHLAPEAGRALADWLAQGGEDDAQDAAEAASARADHAAAPDLAARLRRALRGVAGLAGEEPVDIDVISPLLLADAQDPSVTRLLAGDFMGDFGGFLERQLRESDYRLGYACARAWLPEALEHVGYDDGLRNAVLEAVDARCPGDWRAVDRGRHGLRDLSWRARLELVRLIGRALRVLVAHSAPFDGVRRALRQVRRRRRHAAGVARPHERA